MPAEKSASGSENSESGLILHEVRDRIAFNPPNRPAAMNAMNGQMCDDLKACWVRLEQDDEALVSILRAEMLKEAPPLYIKAIKYGHYRDAQASFREKRKPNFIGR